MNFDATIDARHGFPTSIVDPVGKRLLVSEQFAEYMQRPIDDLLGMPWHLIAHPEDIGSNESAVARLFETGEPAAVRRRLIRGDGSVADVMLFGVRFIDPATRRFVIQGNMHAIPPADEIANTALRSSKPPVDDDLLDYIREISAELSKLVGARNFSLLEYLLTLASAEAAEELTRRWNMGVRDLESLVDLMH